MAPSLADGQVVVVFYFLFTGYSNLSTMTKWTTHKKRWTDVYPMDWSHVLTGCGTAGLLREIRWGFFMSSWFFLSFPLIYTRPKITKSSSIYLYLNVLRRRGVVVKFGETNKKRNEIS
jgi:hypothetical protein